MYASLVELGQIHCKAGGFGDYEHLIVIYYMYFFIKLIFQREKFNQCLTQNNYLVNTHTLHSTDSKTVPLPLPHLKIAEIMTHLQIHGILHLWSDRQ